MTGNVLEDHGMEESEIEKHIKLAAENLKQSSGKNLDRIIDATLHRFDNDAVSAAESLVAQKIFQKTADCPDPLKVALAAVKRKMS